MITATNWTASVYTQVRHTLVASSNETAPGATKGVDASPPPQMEQARLIKAKFPKLPVYVYTGFGNADGYNNHTWEAARWGLLAWQRACQLRQTVTVPRRTARRD